MILFLIFSLFGLSLAGAKFLRCQPASSWFLSCAFITIFLYFFSLFGLLPLSSYIISGLGLLFFLIFFIESFLKKDFSDFLNPEHRIPIIGLIFVYILFGNSYYYHWDEFSFWGTASKQIFNTGSLLTESSQLIVKNYIPGAALFHYYFYTFLGWSEGNSYIAQFFIILSVINILIPGGFSENKYRDAFLLYFFVIATFFFDTHSSWGFLTLYVDNLLGIIFGGILLFYHSQEKNFKTWFFLGILLSFLTSIKHMGFILSLMAGFYLIFDLFISSNKDRLFYLKSFFKIIFIFGFPIITFLAWERYKGIYFSTPLIKMAPGINDVLQAMGLKSGQTETQKNIINAFIVNFLNYKNLLRLLFVSSISIFSIYLAKNPKVLIKRYSIIYLGFLAYALLHIPLYLFVFGVEEGLRVASFQRYMDIYLMGITVISIFFLIKSPPVNLKILKHQKIFFILLFLATAEHIPHFVKTFVIGAPLRQERASIKNMKAKILEHTKVGETIYVVYQGQHWVEPYFILIYEISDRKIINGNFKDLSSQNGPINYNYILLGKIESDFDYPFANRLPPGFKDGELYKVKKDGEISRI